MPSPEATPAPARGRFDRKVAVALALVAAVAVAVLIAAVYLLALRFISAGAQLRAEAMARAAAAAVAPETPPLDADGYVARLRDASPEARTVTLRAADGAVLARARRPDPPGSVDEDEAGVPVGRASLPAGTRLAPGGSLELVLERSPLLGFLRQALFITVCVGALLVVAAGVLGGRAARRLTAPVRHLLADARRMAGGDLAVEVLVHGTDEMADLSDHFNTLAHGLRRMIADLRAAAEQVGAATQAIGDTSRAQVRAVQGETTALEETASTVAEMAVASRLATESAQLVIEVAERSETLWRQGSEAVRDGMVGLTALEGRVGAIAGAVTELSERTVQIGGIIATVKDLAEQSNVLALNAAIEAAKVGASGKGFAVVAEEMRRLAEQSRRATDEVRANLVELQRATRKVVVATGEGSEQARAATLGAEQARATISGLATAIEESSRAARGIADTTRRQTEEMDGIASAVEYLHRNMSSTLEGAQRIDEVAQELARVSERLAEAVSSYRI